MFSKKSCLLILLISLVVVDTKWTCYDGNIVIDSNDNNTDYLKTLFQHPNCSQPCFVFNGRGKVTWGAFGCSFNRFNGAAQSINEFGVPIPFLYNNSTDTVPDGECKRHPTLPNIYFRLCNGTHCNKPCINRAVATSSFIITVFVFALLLIMAP